MKLRLPHGSLFSLSFSLVLVHPKLLAKTLATVDRSSHGDGRRIGEIALEFSPWIVRQQAPPPESAADVRRVLAETMAEVKAGRMDPNGRNARSVTTRPSNVRRRIVVSLFRRCFSRVSKEL